MSERYILADSVRALLNYLALQKPDRLRELFLKIYKGEDPDPYVTPFEDDREIAAFDYYSGSGKVIPDLNIAAYLYNYFRSYPENDEFLRELLICAYDMKTGRRKKFYDLEGIYKEKLSRAYRSIETALNCPEEMSYDDLDDSFFEDLDANVIEDSALFMIYKDVPERILHIPDYLGWGPAVRAKEIMLGRILEEIRSAHAVTDEAEPVTYQIAELILNGLESVYICKDVNEFYRVDPCPMDMKDSLNTKYLPMVQTAAEMRIILTGTESMDLDSAAFSLAVTAIESSVNAGICTEMNMLYNEHHMQYSAALALHSEDADVRESFLESIPGKLLRYARKTDVTPYAMNAIFGTYMAIIKAGDFSRMPYILKQVDLKHRASLSDSDKQKETHHKLKDANKEIGALQKENSDLKEQLKELEAENKALYKSPNERTLQELENANQKIRHLEALLEKKNQAEAVKESEIQRDDIVRTEKKEAETIPPVDTSGNYLFICMHEPLAQKIMNEFPNSSISTNRKLQDAMAKNLDAVVCITKDAGHAEYYRVKEYCRKQNIPFINCNSVNLDIIKSDMAAFFHERRKIEEQ